LRVLPVLVDRDTEGADWFTLLAKPDFGRFAKEPDQNDFVYTLRHGFVLPPHRTGTCGTRDHLPYIHLTDNLGDASSHSCGDQSDVPQGIRADFRNRGSHFIDLPLQPPVVYSVAQVKTQTPRSPIC
jgi:hypothetical protein